jgi:di/tricarboxylate transporter
MQIAIVLGLLVFAVVLFALEKISVDLITLLLLLALVVTGILTPAEAFAGFSNEIIIILGSIFVVSAALQETGVLDAIGARLFKIASGSEKRLLAAVMIVPAAISGFMNNTTVTAMFLPPVIGIARRAKLSPSRLLLPLAYASILGGTCTLIGTSTNVAVSGYIKKSGLAPLGLFEFTPLGLILVATGVLYMLLLGRRLLPDHREETLTADYHIREYLSEIVVLPNSPLIGQQTLDSDLNILDCRILRLIRGDQSHVPESQITMEEGDTLLVRGKAENLMKVKKIEGIDIKPDKTLGDVAGAEFQVVEVLIEPSCEVVGSTLRQADFRQRYGVTVLAIFRHGRPLLSAIGDIVLQVGDLLLIQAAKDRLDALNRQLGFAALGQLSPSLYDKRYGIFAVGIFIAAIAAGGSGILPLSVAFLAAAVGTILLRCVAVEKAYNYIDWRLLILIGGMTAFGTAMEKTGTAEFLAAGIAGLLEPFGVFPILIGFFVLTVILTQPMSNAAAALVVLPVALSTAEKLGVNERTFAISIMLAASVSFLTPFEPSCVLVYGPGKYKFRDFVKTGAFLTVVLSIVVLICIPIFWPLHQGSVPSR